MDVIVDRCAALDVHKKTVMACVRTPDGAGGRRQVVREFRTFRRDLARLREWLRSQRKMNAAWFLSTASATRYHLPESRDGFATGRKIVRVSPSQFQSAETTSARAAPHSSVSDLLDFGVAVQRRRSSRIDDCRGGTSLRRRERQDGG